MPCRRAIFARKVKAHNKERTLSLHSSVETPQETALSAERTADATAFFVEERQFEIFPQLGRRTEIILHLELHIKKKKEQ